MGLEEITEGSVLTQSNMTEYGIEPTELKIGDESGMYRKDRTRLLLEKQEDKYFVAAVYKLPKIRL